MNKNSYRTDIESRTLNNQSYRKVLNTTKEMQLVVMSLKAGEEIELEKHEKTTQFFRIEKGCRNILIKNIALASC